MTSKYILNKLTEELSYRVPDGLIDFNNDEHLIIFSEILMEYNIPNEDVIDVLANIILNREKKKLNELDFQSQDEFNLYVHQHDIKPTTHVTVAKKTLKQQDVKKTIDTHSAKKTKSKPTSSKETPFSKTASNEKPSGEKPLSEKQLADHKKKMEEVFGKILSHVKINSADKAQYKIIANLLANNKDISAAQAKFMSNYIRPSESNDSKFYFTIKEPGNFSQYGDARGDIEGAVGKRICDKLKKHNVPVAYGKTTSAGKPLVLAGKKLVPNKIFADNHDEVSKGTATIKLKDNTLTIYDSKNKPLQQMKKIQVLDKSSILAEIMVELKKKNPNTPSDQLDKQADHIATIVNRHNKIIDILAESGTLEHITDPEHPDLSPLDPKNINHYQQLAGKKISSKMQELLSGEFNDAHKVVVQRINKLGTLKGDAFDKELNDVMKLVDSDEQLKAGTADLIESLSYMRQLSKGYTCVMPTAANFVIADILTLNPNVDYNKLSGKDLKVNDLLDAINLIDVTYDATSIKSGAGGASASPSKIDASTFAPKPPLTEQQVKDDMHKMINMSSIFDDKTDQIKSRNEYINLAKKYGYNVDKNTFTGIQSEANKYVDSIMKRNPTLDGKKLREQWTNYILTGRAFEHMYNDNLKSQTFVNESWKVSKKDGLQIHRTDGVDKLGFLKFEYSVGFSATGRPTNSHPTRFENMTREEYNAKKLKKKK